MHRIALLILRGRWVTPAAATAAVVAVLAAGVGTASADSLSVNDTVLGIAWAPLRFIAAGTSISCPISLDGTFHRATIAKVAASLVGSIRSADVDGACTGGTATILRGTLPWHIRYERFTGTLPAIASVGLQLIGMSISVDPTGTPPACLAATTTSEPGIGAALVDTTTGVVDGLDADETGAIDLSGGFLCDIAGDGAIEGTARVTGLGGDPLVVRLIGGRREPPPPDPLVVSVGDSFISGEAGRWAGNTTWDEAEGIERIDALRAGAYFDDEGGTAERIPYCHRSRAAEIYFGVAAPPWGENLACSGAKTRTEIYDEAFTPGLDFYNGAEGRGQALMLQEYAEAHPNAIKLVAISIGGNNFGFADLIAECVGEYISFRLCSTDDDVTEMINEANVTTHTEAIKEGILEVHTAMEAAGYGDERYKLSIQDYSGPLPTSADLRYPEDERWDSGGCPLYDEDIDWAVTQVLPTVNEAVWAAVTATGLENIVRLELQSAFDGHRLCERGVGLLEEMEVEHWTEPSAVDATEWIAQIRVLPSDPFLRQEGLHPNYWGQKALRSCLRLVYNEGAPISGACTIAGTGKNAFGEPRMRLD